MSIDNRIRIDARLQELAEKAGDAGEDAEVADGVEREITEMVEHAGDSRAEAQSDRNGPTRSRYFLPHVVLAGLVLILALVTGYLKWQEGSARLSEDAIAQSVSAATESTIAILSYRPDTAEKELTAARDRLTGSFRDDYTTLINDLIIPGAKEKQISAVATVPAAAPISANAGHAVVVVFINQTTTIGDGPPTFTKSTVRVTLEKAHNQWLISQFDPV